MTLYANFDEYQPEKLVGTIGGREWDITELPLDVSLFINRRQAERKREGLQMLQEDYFDALLMWLQIQDEDITSEWLTSNITGVKLNQIIIPVFLQALNAPLVKFAEKTAIKGGKSKTDPHKAKPSSGVVQTEEF